jgi:hypothetical protein
MRLSHPLLHAGLSRRFPPDPSPGGTIRFESQEGRGTTFMIRLPIADRLETEEIAESERKVAGL